MYVFKIRGSFCRLFDMPLAYAERAAMQVMSNRNETPVYRSVHQYREGTYIEYGVFDSGFIASARHGTCELLPVTPIVANDMPLNKSDVRIDYAEWETFVAEAIASDDNYYERQKPDYNYGESE